MKNNFIIYTDGGARGNPGPAAIGYVAFAVKKGGALQELRRKGETIGTATNNQAEYRALIAALEYALTHTPDALEVRLDSELVGKQLRGEYRVKDKDLKPLYAQAKLLETRCKSVSYTLIPRELNKDADREVNRALDA
ncbi:MAG: ribonuclease HI family protein [Patescibacteria group bacterium]